MRGAVVATFSVVLLVGIGLAGWLAVRNAGAGDAALDATPGGSAQPTAAVPVAVSEGLFLRAHAADPAVDEASGGGGGGALKLNLADLQTAHALAHGSAPATAATHGKPAPHVLSTASATPRALHLASGVKLHMAPGGPAAASAAAAGASPQILAKATTPAAGASVQQWMIHVKGPVTEQLRLDLQRILDAVGCGSAHSPVATHSGAPAAAAASATQKPALAYVPHNTFLTAGTCSDEQAGQVWAHGRALGVLLVAALPAEWKSTAGAAAVSAESSAEALFPVDTDASPDHNSTLRVQLCFDVSHPSSTPAQVAAARERLEMAAATTERDLLQHLQAMPAPASGQSVAARVAVAPVAGAVAYLSVTVATPHVHAALRWLVQQPCVRWVDDPHHHFHYPREAAAADGPASETAAAEGASPANDAAPVPAPVAAPQPKRKPRFHLQNDVAHRVIQSGGSGDGTHRGVRTPITRQFLDGTGQVVAVADTGVDFDSCYFADPAYYPIAEPAAGTPPWAAPAAVTGAGIPFNSARSPLAPTTRVSSATVHRSRAARIAAAAATAAAHNATALHSSGGAVIDDDADHWRDGGATLNLRHRKVVAYLLPLSPEPILPNSSLVGDHIGHGTHTAGSIAGCALYDPATQQLMTADAYARVDPLAAASAADETGPAAYNGMAPGAKLVVVDYRGPGDDELLVPEDVYNEYFDRVYAQTPARIYSNSWGADDTGYDSYCAETDAFVWSHPDALLIFAAGNKAQPSGPASTTAQRRGRGAAGSFPSSGAGPFTITSPALAKNTIAVGSHLNSVDGSVLATRSSFSARGPTSDNRIKPDVLAPGERIRSATSDFKLSNGGPSTGGYSGGGGGHSSGGGAGNSHSVGGNNCGTGVLQGTSMATPIVAGAAALLRQYFVNGYYVPAREIPAAQIAQVLRSPCGNSQSAADVSPPDLGRGEAYFDRLRDARFARLPKLGLAHAPQLRPAGADTDRRVPSAALLKAALIHSAVPINDTVSSGGYAPNSAQGFGRLQLDRVMLFTRQPMVGSASGAGAGAAADVADDDRSCPAPSLFVSDSRTVATDEQHVYCFVSCAVCGAAPGVGPAAEQSPLRATLVWSDPPSQPMASRHLVNDLDLSVIDVASGAVYLGNQHYAPVEVAPRRTAATGPAMAGANFEVLDDPHFTTAGSADGSGGTDDDDDNEGDAQRQPPQAPQWDDVNTVEHVDVPVNLTAAALHFAAPAANAQRPSVYAVVVRGSRIPHGPQRYALVVSGRAMRRTGSAACGAVLCPNSCYASRGHGVCVPEHGVCRCRHGWAGADCSVPAMRLFNGTAVTLSDAPVGRWSFFYFRLRARNVMRANLTLVATVHAGDPDFYVTTPHGSKAPTSPSSPSSTSRWTPYPSLASYTYANQACDACGRVRPGHDNVHAIPVPVYEYGPGVYKFGVFAYCCTPATFTLRVELARGPYVYARAGTVAGAKNLTLSGVRVSDADEDGDAELRAVAGSQAAAPAQPGVIGLADEDDEWEGFIEEETQGSASDDKPVYPPPEPPNQGTDRSAPGWELGMDRNRGSGKTMTGAAVLLLFSAVFSVALTVACYRWAAGGFRGPFLGVRCFRRCCNDAPGGGGPDPDGAGGQGGRGRHQPLSQRDVDAAPLTESSAADHTDGPSSAGNGSAVVMTGLGSSADALRSAGAGRSRTGSVESSDGEPSAVARPSAKH